MVVFPTNWSLRDEPWQALRALLDDESLSWSNTSFQKAAASGVPQAPGVYLLCTRPVAPISELNPKLFNILYVGQASNSIQARFKYHLSEQAKPKMKMARQVFGNKLTFFWAETMRFYEIESLIYDAYGPPVNDISPPRITGVLGKPRPVKLGRT